MRQKSDYSSYSVEKRLHLGRQSVDLAEQFGIDSTLLMSRRQLIKLFTIAQEYDSLVKWNHENIKLSTKIKDTASLALATFSLGDYYHFSQEYDSAFAYLNRAYKFYKKLGDERFQASALYLIASVQETEKDYAGSEMNTIEAIKLLEDLPNNERNLNRLWDCYNLLGIVSGKLGDYKKSLEYHDRAKRIAEEMSNGFYNLIYSDNNMAFVYKKLGQYDKAINIYQRLIDLRVRYQEQDPTFYPLLLTNLSHTRLMAGNKDYEQMESNFKEAFRITEEENNDIDQLAVSIDLSDFYKKINKKDSAIKYSNYAYKLAKKTSSNEIVLHALKNLSELTPGDNGKAYLQEHIKLSDSLLNVERNVRNKFARIEFETDQIEQENQKMSQQRMWLMITSIGFLVTFLMLYIIITQRAKNKELEFEKDQQRANEEIYNLMLSQQDKVDEARANEKRRVSQELHDGVLGRLFGTRLSLDSLNFSDSKEAVQTRSNYINELKTIENDIRKISHDLNTDFVSGSGFMDIVSELIEKQTKAYQLDYQFDHTDDVNWEFVSNKNKINIYRIIQETLQNIYKHANATKVKIGITLQNNVICLSIKDDGDGFDVNKSRKGIGLKNIQSRVNELGGSVNYKSRPQEGTEVFIEIPYND